MNDRLKSLYQQYRFLMIQANSFYGMCNNQEKIEKNIQMQQKVQKELKKNKRGDTKRKRHWSKRSYEVRIYALRTIKWRLSWMYRKMEVNKWKY